MKRFILILTVTFAFLAANAQWSVGLDARFAPCNDVRQNVGTDITLNYQLNFGNLFVTPSIGFFYQKYTNSTYEITGGGSFPHNQGYRTGIDISAVAGLLFKLGIGKLGFFTGPRYGYAFASKKEFDSSLFADYLPNSFDWRIGASYKIWKITASTKFDIACLKFKKKDSRGYSSDYNQASSIAIGLAYDF